MPSFTSSLSFLLVLLLAIAINASPSPGGHDGGGNSCLSDGQADYLLKSWISFFEKIDPKLADKVIADDFQQISASLNFIEGKLPDAITVPTKADFIAEQINGTAAGTETFVVLDTTHTCNEIIFHWHDNSAPIPLYGFDWLYLRKTKMGKFQIYKAYSEFNNAAILYNAGVFPCPAPTAAA